MHITHDKCNCNLLSCKGECFVLGRNFKYDDVKSHKQIYINLTKYGMKLVFFGCLMFVASPDRGVKCSLKTDNPSRAEQASYLFVL
jgi:hypothetical protein